MTASALLRAATGIPGLDQITGGGLPRGRVTLVTGNAGAGKTILGIEFLVNGIRDYGEPAVLVTFEESAVKVTDNVASLGFDLAQMQSDGTLEMLSFKVDAPASGSAHFDFSPFLVLLDDAITRTSAKRVVLDTIEALFGAYSNDATMRAELTALLRWLEEHGVTAIVTGERGDHSITRHGIEEYVSDCVIVLDHRVSENVSTRLLRIVKFRGAEHGTNEYPFLIASKGFIVQPITSVGLDYAVSSERVSTGVPRLDEMLGGGPYRGSTVLVTGMAGTGKSSIGATMANDACARGEKCLMLLYEESASQLERNMASIGVNLAQWVDAGSLRIWPTRPLQFGMENHLALVLDILDEFSPGLVVMDGLSSFIQGSSLPEVSSFITRKIDILKRRGITSVLTTLGTGSDAEPSEVGVSSLVDTWILLRNVKSGGERNRLLFVIKSRGSAHSNQVRELILSSEGIRLVNVFVGPDGMLTGSARRAQEMVEEGRKSGRGIDAR